MIDEAAIRLRYEALKPVLDERGRRRFGAAEAQAAGHGGVSAVARVTGIARSTIGRGLTELHEAVAPTPGRVRRLGGGRKPLTATDPSLLDDLRMLVEPTTRGDPERPLLWTAKSLRNLSAGLGALGHRVSHNTVGTLLRTLGYSLQANRKTKEGKQHPDRDAQFCHINEKVSAAIDAGQPAISIDTKKKELVGEFKNGGREWRPKGAPAEVSTHDFPSQARGKAIPFGVYDIASDTGYVSVGIDRETAQFSVAAIAAWWDELGRERYPEATMLQITADCGGANGNRLRLWKTELGRLAEQTGLAISVCHFPPGTSKWNKIEHRLWSFISKNWRGRPLVSYEVIINLIAATTTTRGLEVYARLDEGEYPRGVEVSDAELAAVDLTGDEFHPEWNYVIRPRNPQTKR